MIKSKFYTILFIFLLFGSYPVSSKNLYFSLSDDNVKVLHTRTTYEIFGQDIKVNIGAHFWVGKNFSGMPIEVYFWPDRIGVSGDAENITFVACKDEFNVNFNEMCNNRDIIKFEVYNESELINWFDAGETRKYHRYYFNLTFPKEVGEYNMYIQHVVPDYIKKEGEYTHMLYLYYNNPTSDDETEVLFPISASKPDDVGGNTAPKKAGNFKNWLFTFKSEEADSWTTKYVSYVDSEEKAEYDKRLTEYGAILGFFGAGILSVITIAITYLMSRRENKKQINEITSVFKAQINDLKKLLKKKEKKIRRTIKNKEV